MKTSIFRGLPCIQICLCLLGMIANAVGARAQSDDFNDGNDAGWTRYSPLSAVGAGATYLFPAGGYRVKAPPSPAPGTVGPQRAGSLRAVTYTRTRVATDIPNWDNTINQSLGLIARVTKLGPGTTDGYTYNYNTKSGYHQLTLVVGEMPLTPVDESPFRLNPGEGYRMVFTLVDNMILGQTFSLTNPAVPLHSVFGINESHDSGTAGVFAFALDSGGPIDATFDNYSGEAPGQVRATLLDAAPAIGEQPTDPIPTVTVRLANLETSIQTDSIALEIDGHGVVFNLNDASPEYILTYTPAAPLSASAAHTGKVSFADEVGTQTFSWGFGAPAIPAAATLLGSAQLAGPYEKDGSAVLDAGGGKFTVAIGDGPRFFRVSDSVARKITKVTQLGGQLELLFE